MTSLAPRAPARHRERSEGSRAYEALRVSPRSFGRPGSLRMTGGRVWALVIALVIDWSLAPGHWGFKASPSPWPSPPSTGERGSRQLLSRAFQLDPRRLSGGGEAAEQADG